MDPFRDLEEGIEYQRGWRRLCAECRERERRLDARAGRCLAEKAMQNGSFRREGRGAKTPIFT